MANEFKKRNNKYQKDKLVADATIYGLDDALLTLFCSYALSQNQAIHKYGISSLKKLINALSVENFNKNPISVLKYQFLKNALELRVKGISNKDIILSDINRKVDITSLINDQSFLKELSTTEVEYAEETISSFMNNAFMSSNVHTLMDVCRNYLSSNYREKDLYLNQLQKIMGKSMTQFRRNNMNRDNSSTLFRLSSINDSIEDIHKYITAPSYRLVTGMQGLNGMLGGGFEKGRVYSFFGLPGEGKTVTLENLMYQIWKYNKGFKTKDPTKKPCIVYLTMENFVIEYICALYHILTRGKELKECNSIDEAMEEFKRCKFEYTGDNDIELVIKFKPVNSVDTSYMFQITEELEDEGYEVICFIQDYLMRIKPSEITKDSYQDLGTIVNDFKTYATLKQVPVITASQLNREAARIIDEGRGSNQANLIKKLSRSNIGDSVNIDRNLDGSLIIVPEIGPDNKKYMAFKLTKHRYPIYTNKVSIYQPFYDTSEIALVEDVYEAKPAFRESLSRDPEEIRASFGDVERTDISSSIRSLSELNKEAQQNIPVMNPGYNNIAQILQSENQNSTIPKKEEGITLSIENMVEKKPNTEKKRVIDFIKSSKEKESLREYYVNKKW